MQALTPIQLQAIRLLLQGHSQSATARKLPLHRATLWRWLSFHALFITELNRQRKELSDSASRRLQILLRKSLRIVNRQLASQDDATSLKAARAILAHCAPRNPAPDPSVPLHPHDVVDPVARSIRHDSSDGLVDDLPLTAGDRALAIQWLSYNLTAPPDAADPPAA